MAIRLTPARLLGLTLICLPINRALSQASQAKNLQAIVATQSDDSHHDLKGIVVQQHGQLIAESYFNGDDSTTLHDIRSATKSLTSLLVGVAIQKKLIRSIEDPVASYLPELSHDARRTIRIKDLLNMRSGLDADDKDPAAPGNESRLDASPDWSAAALSVPLKTSPGTTYLYNSLTAYLAGAVVTKASGMPLDIFAKQELFAPLGIAAYEWRHLPDGQVTGQGNLQITTRDLARIGQMVLHDGRASGRQIVSPEWIKQSVACEVPIAQVDKYADCYGYMWYTKTERVAGQSVLVHFASGNGGNKIYIVPALDLVVAITSSAYNTAYGQERSHQILLNVLSAMVVADNVETDTVTNGIVATAKDYIEGWYTGDADRMERSLHPDLAKRMVSTDSITGRSVLSQMSAMTLVQKTKRGIGPREILPDRRREDITVLDRYGNAAVVKIVAADWVDYLEEARVDGQWKIINVLWELAPSSPSRNP